MTWQNRKAEGIAQMCEVAVARARAEFEAAGSLAKSLEALTFNEADTMSLEEWGRYKDLAERVQGQRCEFLKAIGALPLLPPRSRSRVFQAGVVQREGADGVGGHEKKAGRRRAKMAGTVKRRTSKGAASPHPEQVEGAPSEQ